MAPPSDELRVFFFPLMTPGHMIPMLDIAKLFRRRGVSVTVVTTPGNEPLVRPTIDRANAAASPAGAAPIDLHLLPFPSSVTHLIPATGENLSSISSSEFGNFVTAAFALQQPLHDLLRGRQFDCLVSDSLFAWTADIALDLGVPRLVFHGPGAFALCVHDSIEIHASHKAVAGDTEPFVVEDLPDRIEMTRSELSEAFDSDFLLDYVRQGEKKSYGVVVNSFYELEPKYAELYRRVPGRKAWFVGPVSLVNEAAADEAERGGRSSGADRWLRWLDSQAVGTVVYVCFGSLCEVSADQMHETAAGLEASGQPFVWVVKGGGAAAEAAEWLPEGFEERVEGKGVIIRGWAPQILILNHPAVGGFVTHCGWNSTLEGVAAGVPMATWPLSYDQFVNEKFITQVARIGVRIRSGDVIGSRTAVVKGEEVAEAVARLMGEAAEGIRRRARELGAMARAAVGEGGSSHADMDRLIDELRAVRRSGGGKEEAEPGVAV